MNVLVIGLGSIVKRRVIPALLSQSWVTRIDLASRSQADAGIVPEGRRGDFFSSYEQALGSTSPGLVYVSLPNSMHAQWATRALQTGSHVIVDKPAGLNLAQTEDMVAVANEKGRCLAESTVWSYHPRYQSAQSILAELRLRITRVSALFSFPPLPPNNFRNDPSLGGGAFLDVGPYAASCSRLFFADAPQDLQARVLTRDPATGLETAFSLLATYGDGRSLTGHFGFNTEYRNSISAFGPDVAFDFDRAFTLPADAASEFVWRGHNQAHSRSCPAGDSFALFLSAVFEAIQRKAWGHFTQGMLQDARFVDEMRASAGVVSGG
jgi:predicted dehydrogenase